MSKTEIECAAQVRRGHAQLPATGVFPLRSAFLQSFNRRSCSRDFVGSRHHVFQFERVWSGDRSRLLSRSFVCARWRWQHCALASARLHLLHSHAPLHFRCSALPHTGLPLKFAYTRIRSTMRGGRRQGCARRALEYSSEHSTLLLKSHLQRPHSPHLQLTLEHSTPGNPMQLLL
jgi:hypothetical protein